MKANKKVACLCAVLSMSLLLTGCGKEIEVKNGSKVAVSTKEEKITATDYYSKIKEDNISTLIDMIDTSILEKKYKKTEDEDKYVEDQISQIKQYYGEDENTYKSVLKQYFGSNNEDELRTKLSLEYKRNKAVNEYIEDHLKGDDIKKYYEEKIFGQIKASHILITVNTKADATEEEKQEADKKAYEKAKKVIKELNSGKKFKNLAKKYSEDKSNASNGGDLGYFELSDMVEEFSNAVKELKKNEYTKEPVKTQYGYHIILRTGEKDKARLEDVKDDIKEKLRTEKLDNDKALYYKTLISIREDNKIKWNDDTLKNAYDKYMQDLIDSVQKNS